MNELEIIKNIQKEFADFDINSLQKSLESIIESTGDVLQAIYDKQPKLKEGEVFIETLIIKLIFATKSAVDISKSSNINSRSIHVNFIDTPSIFILTRSIIEIFLTLEYLYFNDLSDDEKNFRYKLWRISGYKSRQLPIEKISKEFKNKLLREKKLIDDLTVEIKKSTYYSSLDKTKLWKLDKYGLPRIFSWGVLIENSILNSRIFEKVYKLYSNYSHSEYISMIQINEGSLSRDSEENIKNVAIALNNLRLVNATTLIKLKDYFECTNEIYQTLPKTDKIKLEFLTNLATGK